MELTVVTFVGADLELTVALLGSLATILYLMTME